MIIRDDCSLEEGTEKKRKTFKIILHPIAAEFTLGSRKRQTWLLLERRDLCVLMADTVICGVVSLFVEWIFNPGSGFSSDFCCLCCWFIWSFRLTVEGLVAFVNSVFTLEKKQSKQDTDLAYKVRWQVIDSVLSKINNKECKKLFHPSFEKDFSSLVVVTCGYMKVILSWHNLSLCWYFFFSIKYRATWKSDRWTRSMLV